jgi:hypothetical protein
MICRISFPADVAVCSLALAVAFQLHPGGLSNILKDKVGNRKSTVQASELQILVKIKLPG